MSTIENDGRIDHLPLHGLSQRIDSSTIEKILGSKTLDPLVNKGIIIDFTQIVFGTYKTKEDKSCLVHFWF